MERSNLKIWIDAARPKTLWASVSPVVIGSAMAFESGGLHIIAALSALLGAVLIQIGTNFANDYFDYYTGADSTDRLGPTRVVQAGLVPPPTMKAAFIAVFALAAVPGAYLIWRAGLPLFVIGVLGQLLVDTNDILFGGWMAWKFLFENPTPCTQESCAGQNARRHLCIPVVLRMMHLDGDHACVVVQGVYMVLVVGLTGFAASTMPGRGGLQGESAIIGCACACTLARVLPACSSKPSMFPCMCGFRSVSLCGEGGACLGASGSVCS